MFFQSKEYHVYQFLDSLNTIKLLTYLTYYSWLSHYINDFIGSYITLKEVLILFC